MSGDPIQYAELKPLAPGETVEFSLLIVEDDRPLKVKLDASPVEDQIERVEAALATFPPGTLAALAEDGTAFHLNTVPAGRATEYWVVLEALPPLFEKLAAMGAGDADLVRVKEALSHNASSFSSGVQTDESGLSRGGR